MKNYIFIFLLIFISCKKEETTHPVIYKVTVIGGSPSYSVQYSSAKNTSVSQGPFSSDMWISDKIEKTAGSVASLTLNGGTGGSYKLYIYIDGVLQQDGRMDDPYGPKTISIAVPD